MAKLNESEEQILQQIAKWKAEQPGFLTKAAELASRPLVWLADKVIPSDIKNNLSEATEKVIERLQDASQWTVDEKSILEETKKYGIPAEKISELKSASIQDLDTVSDSFVKSNSQIAAAEGFGTGLIGLPGLLADLPALITLAFRLVNQTALCYGYSISEKEEGLDERDAFEIGYMLRVMRVSSASSLEEKIQSLMELKEYEIGYESDEMSRTAPNYVRQQLSKTAVIHASKALVGLMVKQTVARKAMAALPGIGAVLSAGFNYAWLQDVGHSAQMLYKERFLKEKKGKHRIVDVKID